MISKKKLEWLLWQRMLFNRGGAYIGDWILLLFGLNSILNNGQYYLLIIIFFIRWLFGKLDYHYKIIQIENELALRKQNPYMHEKLTKNSLK